jgi:nucleoside-diphosphate-sugar epimerase
MKSLVTGASGFIGGHLVHALVASGDQVRILVRPSSDLRHVASLDVDRRVGDLTDPRSLRTAIAGMDRVFHCAAVVSDWGAPAVFRAVNVKGTENLLAAALEARVQRFVHVSSTDVYGHTGHLATEDAPFRYRGWPYGDTKIDAEKAVWAYAGRGLPVTVVRPATVYGPRAGIVIEIAKLLRQKEMVFIGTGETDVGLCYVENLTTALLLASGSDIGLGRAYNVADGLGITWEHFVNRLARFLGQDVLRRRLPYKVAYAAAWVLERWAQILPQPSRPLLTRMSVELLGTPQCFPTLRVRKELGWEPRVDFEEGMRRLEMWMRSSEGPLRCEV